ncbi:MAG TPA: ABC transporter permease [Thermoanaerobaculia bacterium]|nr:ABC transporter permease [Thermoanaerobaculia bacterium]
MTGPWLGAILLSGLTAATPLLLAAMGETVRERAGLLDIGIEGEMLAGAFAAWAVAGASGSALVGAAAAAAAGMALAALFGSFVVGRRADPIVAGTALNLVVLGATGVLLRMQAGGVRPSILLPPAAGPLTPIDVAAIASVPLVFLFLFRTSWGLRLRATGESLADADALKVPTKRYRMAAAIAGGALTGLAGASLTLELSDTFLEGMTAGRGFVALALVAFGRWKPFPVAAACLGFGLLQAIQFQLQARGVLGIPPQALLMLPYVLSLAALALRAGTSRAPADLGKT